jgi:hypothetical protein
MGIEIMRPFDVTKHDISRKFWEPCEGKFMCTDLMSWFVNRGADLSDSEPQTYHFYRHIRVTSRLKVTEQARNIFPEVF